MSAELTLISIGLFPILNGNKLHFTPTKPASIERQAKRLVQSFLAKESPDKLGKLPDFSWEDTNELLNNLNPEKTIEAVIQAFTDNEALGMEVVGLASRIMEDLKVNFPIRIRETITGDIQLKPSTTDIARFARRWNVAIDPTIILTDLAEHSLSTEQVEALQTYYPEYLNLIKQMVLDQLVNIKAKRKDWQLDMPREGLLRKLFLQPRAPITPPSEQQQQAATTPPKQGKPLKLNTTKGTPGQREAS